MEFQQWKHHSGISKLLKDGTRVAYGARALIKGGISLGLKCHSMVVLLLGIMLAHSIFLSIGNAYSNEIRDDCSRNRF